ncbi:hypothetical protein MUK42_19162 [Musa troglodytarum]|uniref:Uncharacterized protein n=1 Tax=Musa troglodytarum TaxID=320322 RepID=A0A9E7K8B6_9LILI|nr:hypothetical protein MUK42_19162 [Musa troglodytarum]
MFPRPGMSRKVVRIILKLPRWECLLIVNAPVQKTKDLVKLTCRREPSSYPQSWRGIKILEFSTSIVADLALIITDEKATNLPLPLSVSADHVTKLEVCARKLPRGFGVNPIQLESWDGHPGGGRIVKQRRRMEEVML